MFEEWLKEADPVPETAELTAETANAMRATERALVTAEAARPTDAQGLAARSRPVRTAGQVVAAFAIVPAPWGPLHVAATERGVAAIELASETPDFASGLERRLGGEVVHESDAAAPAEYLAHIENARRQLEEYFAGSRSTFDLPVDLRGVSEWDRLVLSGAVRLGFGEVTSYGGLARLIGRPRAARAVGGALGRNPIPIVIPCHRIVASDGTLGGYGGGGHGSRQAMLSVKRTLLRLECAPVTL